MQNNSGVNKAERGLKLNAGDASLKVGQWATGIGDAFLSLHSLFDNALCLFLTKIQLHFPPIIKKKIPNTLL